MTSSEPGLETFEGEVAAALAVVVAAVGPQRRQPSSADSTIREQILFGLDRPMTEDDSFEEPVLSMTLRALRGEAPF